MYLCVHTHIIPLLEMDLFIELASNFSTQEGINELRNVSKADQS